LISLVNTRLVEESYSVYCPKHNQVKSNSIGIIFNLFFYFLQMNINKSKVNRRTTTTTSSINDSQEI